jgi:hypothetical protein
MLCRFVLSMAFLAGPLQGALQTNYQQTARMALPEGNGSWSVTIETSGGSTGKGEGDLAVSSQGKIACSSGLRCASDFVPLDMQPLLDAMQNVSLPARSPSLVSSCRDCITTTITIRRRDSMGVVQIYSGSWDETTRDKFPQEVVRIYDAVVALKK